MGAFKLRPHSLIRLACWSLGEILSPKRAKNNCVVHLRETFSPFIDSRKDRGLNTVLTIITTVIPPRERVPASHSQPSLPGHERVVSTATHAGAPDLAACVIQRRPQVFREGGARAAGNAPQDIELGGFVLALDTDVRLEREKKASKENFTL